MIHIRGSATVDASDVGTIPVFYLPVGARPEKFQGFPIGASASITGDGAAAFLYVSPDGRVQIDNEGGAGLVMILVGDVQFRAAP